ncbi:hypothetical protein AB0G73_18175 [Streptomyces sp. NPDC020719]|uniref:hypothetical protein n=1 Tax=Streptomyces sp. NPDC020719 TaxID=3154896 RepID=UPI0033E60723
MTTAAPQEPKARRAPVKALALAAAVVVLAAGVGTWLALRSDGGGSGPSCATVGENARIRKDLAPADPKDMNCQELAAALKKAAASDGSGRHTLQQAGVMRDLVNTLDEDFHNRSKADMAGPLRETVADLLADYSTDMHTTLVNYGGSAVYNMKHDGPWRDDKGVVRMPVYSESLTRVMRAVSDDPAAYATLRKAETARSADDLARISRTSAGYALSVPVTDTASVLGLLDGIAEDLLAARTTSEAARWKGGVMKGLSDGDASPVPAYSADPARYIARTWERSADGYPALVGQTRDMVGILVKASGRSAESVTKPLSQVADSGQAGKERLNEALINIGASPKGLRT